MRRMFLLGGKWVEGEQLSEVRSPWDGRVVTQVSLATRQQADAALALAQAARLRLQQQTTAKRREVLERIATGLRERASEIASAICDETAKPITAARFE